MEKKKINHYTVEIPNPSSWDEYFYNMCVTVASNSKCLSRKIGAVIANGHTIISTGYNGPSRDVRRCDERWFVDEELVNEFNKRVTERGRSDKVIKKIGNRCNGRHDYECTIFDIGEDLNGKIYGSERWKKDFQGKCPRYVEDMGYKSGQGLEWCVAGHAERNAIVNAARKGMPPLEGDTIYMSCGVPCTPCLIEIKNSGITEIVCTDIAFYSGDVSCKYQLKESGLKIRKFDFIED
jgi:dCMP deaminase